MFADVTPYDLFREQFSRGSTPEAGMSLTTAESGQVQAYCWANSNITRQRVRTPAFFVRRYNSRNALSSAFNKFPTYCASGLENCFPVALDPMPIPKNLPALSWCRLNTQNYAGIRVREVYKGLGCKMTFQTVVRLLNSRMSGRL